MRRMMRIVTAIIGGAGLWIGVPRPSAAFDCAGVTPAANTSLVAVPVVTGLSGRPLLVLSPPGDTNRLFVVEQSGFIRIKKRGDPTGTLSTFLDLSAKVQATPTLDEMGLLGLAFDPDYRTNGSFYVNYTEGPLNGPWFTVVARYLVSANPDVADPGSEERLLRFQQPQTNHNGGQLMFGPDGYLYISTGDGGGGGISTVRAATPRTGASSSGRSCASTCAASHPSAGRPTAAGPRPSTPSPATTPSHPARAATATRSGPTACATPGDPASIP